MRLFHKGIVVDPALIKMADTRQEARIAVAPAAEGVACANAEGDEQGAPEAKAKDANGNDQANEHVERGVAIGRDPVADGFAQAHAARRGTVFRLRFWLRWGGWLRRFFCGASVRIPPWGVVLRGHWLSPPSI